MGEAVRDVSVSRAAELQAAGGQLVDVRSRLEYGMGSLPGAVNIPLGDLLHRQGELDPARPVLLLCRSGSRSAMAAMQLARAGFENVVNLAGGMTMAKAKR